VSDDNILGIVITLGVVISAPIAIRATWRLWRLWRLDDERSLLLLAFWVTALIVTAAGLWVGVLQVRRLIGYPPLDWSPPITGVLTIIVLQIPMILDSVTQRVQHNPSKPDNIGGADE
jgi:uncharacterized membrane protein